MGMSNPPPDCLRCGVCCFSPAERFVRVTGSDWARLGESAEQVAHFIGRGNEAYMKMTDGHCAALEVRRGPGANGEAEYFCTIYDRRPQICRDLARGSPECAGERALKVSAAD
jgi:Fe-S-cluster containining protein